MKHGSGAEHKMICDSIAEYSAGGFECLLPLYTAGRDEVIALTNSVIDMTHPALCCAFLEPGNAVDQQKYSS